MLIRFLPINAYSAPKFSILREFLTIKLAIIKMFQNKAIASGAKNKKVPNSNCESIYFDIMLKVCILVSKPDTTKSFLGLYTFLFLFNFTHDLCSLLGACSCQQSFYVLCAAKFKISECHCQLHYYRINDVVQSSFM